MGRYIILRQWAIKEDNNKGLRNGATLDPFNTMLKIDKIFFESCNTFVQFSVREFDGR